MSFLVPTCSFYCFYLLFTVLFWPACKFSVSISFILFHSDSVGVSQFPSWFTFDFSLIFSYSVTLFLFSYSLDFSWREADASIQMAMAGGWCWFFLEKSTAGWLVADGWCWFGVREKHCWLVAVNRVVPCGMFILVQKIEWDKNENQSDVVRSFYSLIDDFLAPGFDSTSNGRGGNIHDPWKGNDAHR